MRLTHLGGKSCVTGSCHLLQTSGLNIMIDCGITQGHDRSISMDKWEVPPSKIDFLFLTHAHIDHIGRVPDLIEQGFVGEIICTHPTRALIFPMLADAMGFSERSRDDQARLTRKIEDLTWGFEYGQYFDLTKGIRFKLGNAGHILGSAFIYL